MRRFLVFISILLLVVGSVAVAEDKPIRQTTIEGMTSHHNLKYLPPDRYLGDDKSLRGDYEMLLDLHIPNNGKGPFPVVFYVHGGSWTGGTKEGQKELAAELNKRGIAFCGFNYILKPKGIFPQVWWDFHNAARFLRKNADKYNIDPLRFGAYGLSAGGWVISSASMPSGDYVVTSYNGGAISVTDLIAQGGKVKVRSPEDEFAWLKPMRDPSPAWPGEAGGFSALAWDFAYHVDHGDAGSPSIQQWAGKGAKPRNIDKILANNIRITLSEMTGPKYVGQQLHLPPFFKRNTNEASDTLDLDGKPGKLLGEVVADFFVRELTSPSARPPAPEIYPIPRIINAPTSVTMLAPRGVTIHYTTDGSDPTTTSPTYKQSLTIAPGTTVKAISVAPGMTPSGPMLARFVAGTPAPLITGPDSLPDGETGKPFSITFSADKPKARWNIQGDLVPYIPFRKDETAYPNNMKLDPATGTWTGTPTQPGTYRIQIWVAHAPGTIASYRNYRWIVTGKMVDETTIEVARDDQNQQLATLNRWPAGKVEELLGELNKAKLRVISPNESGDTQVMILVHTADKAEAQTVLKNFLVRQPAELVKEVLYPSER